MFGNLKEVGAAKNTASLQKSIIKKTLILF
jgi:hypothetical protein